MKRVTGAVVLALVMGACDVAGASDASLRLQSRGLVEFHAGRYAEALDLFERAVQSDADDVDSLYYRGLTRGRLGDYAGSVADLGSVVYRQPQLRQARLELGVALVHAERYERALPWLEQAQRVPADEATASLFLAIAQLNLNRIDEAQQNLERAAADPDLGSTVRYYQGVAAYRARQWDEAAGYFADVSAATPDSDIGREAAAFLDALERGKGRPYEVFGAVAFQYDSNVVLAPSEEVLKDAAGISDEDDGRFTLSAGGAYVPWHNDRVRFVLGYELFQSLHFDLTEFNLHDQRPTAQVVYDAGPVELGLLGGYDYYLLDDESFLQDGTGMPWLSAATGEWGRADVWYRVRRRDFFMDEYRIRDAWNHAVSVRQLVYLGGRDRTFAVSYRFDHEDPVHGGDDSKQFGYNAHEVAVGLTWLFPAAVSADVGYVYRHEDYASASDGRDDDTHRVLVAGRKALTDYLSVTAAYLGSFNDSDKNFFEYDRHIGSLSVEVRY